MKKLLAVMAVLMLLCACANRGTVQKPNEEEESTPPAVEEVSPDTSPGPAEEELDVDIGDPSFATGEIPADFSVVEVEAFSVLVLEEAFSSCAPGETVAMENGQFVGDNGEEKRVIVQLLSVEDVADSSDPFAPYDQKYADSVNTVDLVLGGFGAKKYHMQTQSEGPVPMKINTLYYCICLEDQMVTFAYYPVAGMGGLHTEDIETILNTITPTT